MPTRPLRNLDIPGYNYRRPFKFDYTYLDGKVSPSIEDIDHQKTLKTVVDLVEYTHGRQ